MIKNVQGGSKVGGCAKSRYTVINYILYTYFWPTLYIGLHVKYPNSCQVLTKLDSSQRIFEIPSNIKFHKKSLQW